MELTLRLDGTRVVFFFWPPFDYIDYMHLGSRASSPVPAHEADNVESSLMRSFRCGLDLYNLYTAGYFEQDEVAAFAHHDYISRSVCQTVF